MTEEEYEYDAFISYRHVEPDRSHAMWLHKALETYRVPKDLVGKGFPARLKKVFRDEEELPASADLSGEIDRGLRRSKFLIVICSPRIISSIWCDAEVKKFRELGRHDRIIALLTEGEPSDSFLPSLCEIRQHVVKDGAKVEEIEAVEPLAADIRERPDQSQRELKHLAKLRLLACILGCKFDDLRRRELRRKQRMYMSVAGFMAILLICFASLTLWALQEKKKAEENRLLAIENEQRALIEKTIAESRKKELLEEKLEVLKVDINKCEEKSEFFRALKTIVKSIDICIELGREYSSYITRLESAYNNNRLIGHIPMKELPESLTFTKNGKFILASFPLKSELQIISVKEKKRLHKIKLKKVLNSHSSSIIRVLESGGFCHIYNDGKGAHWVKWDPYKGEILEEKFIQGVQIRSYSGVLNSSSKKFHTEYVLAESTLESTHLFKVLKVEDFSESSSFNHHESIFEVQFSKPKDGLVLAFRDSSEKFYLLKNGLKTQIPHLSSADKFYLNGKSIIVSGKSPFLIPLDDLSSKISFNNKESVFISESGKAFYSPLENTHIKPSPGLVPIRKIPYGVKKIIDQEEKKRIIALSDTSVSIFSGNKRFYIDQITKVRASDLYRDVLVTAGHYGNINIWDLSIKKSYSKIVSVPEGISYIDKSKTRKYIVIRPKGSLKFKVFNTSKEESREVVFPISNKKFAIIKFSEKKNFIAYIASDEFKYIVTKDQKFPQQELWLYDLSKEKWRLQLNEKDAYSLRDFRLVSLNDSSPLKYQSLSSLGEWKYISESMVGKKDFHLIHETAESIFCIPYSGQNRDRIIRVNLVKNEMKILKPLPESSGIFPNNSVSEGGKYIIRVINDGKKTRCYLHDLEKDEIKAFPKDIKLEQGGNVDMNASYLIVSHGYPTNLTLYDLKTYQQVLKVQLPSSISTFEFHQLKNGTILIKDKILAGTAFVVSPQTNKVLREIKMDVYEPLSGFYLKEESNLFSIKNVNDADFLYVVEVDDYPDYKQFSHDGKSIIFSQSDGLYKLDFLKSEEGGFVNKARKLIEQVGDL